MSTTKRMRQPGADGLKFQGREVLDVRHGTCMHCKADVTSLLVVNASGKGRIWLTADWNRTADVAHTCSRAK